MNLWLIQFSQSLLHSLTNHKLFLTHVAAFFFSISPLGVEIWTEQCHDSWENWIFLFLASAIDCSEIVLLKSILPHFFFLCIILCKVRVRSHICKMLTGLQVNTAVSIHVCCRVSQPMVIT